ncbi:guanylate cyclase [Plakobranchus ocellatus]|uniref:Guanylate cyclase n=1 Tax=Plakobranchus ocellatus TaxID=259542 RepID=A0AAV4DBK6_9GAST|nr:guanylate cyclase [Plakobranchus ocellatus]
MHRSNNDNTESELGLSHLTELIQKSINRKDWHDTIVDVWATQTPDNNKNKKDNDETSALTVVITVGLAMLAAVIAFFILFRWWKRERALSETSWKVKFTDLDFDVSRGPLSQNNMTSTSRGSTHPSDPDMSDNNSSNTMDTMTNPSSTRRDNMLMIVQMFTVVGVGNVARLRGDLVAVRKINKKSVKEDKSLLKEMRKMKLLKHTNLATFHGACIEAPNVCVLWEYCSKGSIEDILNNADIKLEALFQFSLAVDIASGLTYLHNSELGVHGNLRASNCVVDSRWVAKLTDFGNRCFRKGEKRAEDSSDDKHYSKLLWTAPEVLRAILNKSVPVMTKESDIYSLGVVFKQLLNKNGAYAEDLVNSTPKEIIHKVANPELDKLMRPHMAEEFQEHTVLMLNFKRLVVSCWAEDPLLRPNIKKIASRMRKISPLKSNGVLDNMLALMERYSNRLEDLVSERTLQLEEEKRKTDTLLYRMLPRKVADNLKRGENVQAEAFACVTVYFSDIVGFTTLASESQPMEIVEMLNLLYSHFDDVISNYDVYKVETIGDAYMVVSGCPNKNEDHASVMAHTSLALLNSVKTFIIPHRPHDQLKIRIGLNSGPVVAGVVGNTMPRYCLFGNTVNLASRMESHGLPLKIQASATTYELLKDSVEFTFEPRGDIDVKGKGQMATYWLYSRTTITLEPPSLGDALTTSNGGLDSGDLQVVSSYNAKNRSPGRHDGYVLMMEKNAKDNDVGGTEPLHHGQKKHWVSGLTLALQHIRGIIYREPTGCWKETQLYVTVDEPLYHLWKSAMNCLLRIIASIHTSCVI